MTVPIEPDHTLEMIITGVGVGMVVLGLLAIAVLSSMYSEPGPTTLTSLFAGILLAATGATTWLADGINIGDEHRVQHEKVPDIASEYYDTRVIRTDDGYLAETGNEHILCDLITSTEPQDGHVEAVLMCEGDELERRPENPEP